MQRVLDFIHAPSYLHVQNNGVGIRGLFTKEMIPKDKIVFAIPSDKFIGTSDKKMNEDEHFMTIAKRLKMNRTSTMTLWLMMNYIDEDTVFSPYFETMPKPEDYSWRNIVLSELTGTFLLSKTSILSSQVTTTKKQFQAINIAWNHLPKLREKCKTGKRFFELYPYVYNIIQTRVFGYTFQKKKQSALVPVLDMMNHSNKPNIKWEYNSKTHSFSAKAIFDIPKNSELLDSYGSTKHYYSLFYNYGIPPSIDDIKMPLEFNNKIFMIRNNTTVNQICSIENIDAMKCVIQEKIQSYKTCIEKTSNESLKQLLEKECAVLEKNIR